MKRIQRHKIVSVPMERGLIKMIRAYSKQEKRTLASMVRVLLEEALALRGKQ